MTKVPPEACGGVIVCTALQELAAGAEVSQTWGSAGHSVILVNRTHALLCKAGNVVITMFRGKKAKNNFLRSLSDWAGAAPQKFGT